MGSDPVSRTDAARFAQVNLLAVPRDLAFDLLLFCQRNPRPCGLTEVSDPGATTLSWCAPTADVRRDAHRYRIWRDGELEQTTDDATPWWREDLVTFAIGCSFTLATALERAGIAFVTGGVYRSDVACAPAGRLAGPQWVSMRWMAPADALRATRVTARFPSAHGAPVHVGDPAGVGIEDLAAPTYALATTPPPPDGSVPVFWGCSVTAEEAARAARPELMISLDPPHMFGTDRLIEELAS
jgi:uncharacterized protein YcsI (UPF0317 family)